GRWTWIRSIFIEPPQEHPVRECSDVDRSQSHRAQGALLQWDSASRNRVMPDALPHIVILGGGFGGLAATRALARARARITLVDRHNHHLFQPLLYQVATAGLSAPSIAAPLRQILRHQRNVTVLMDEVAGIDLAQRRVQLQRESLDYDWLIVHRCRACLFRPRRLGYRRAGAEVA